MDRRKECSGKLIITTSTPFYTGKCPETSTDFALKPAHLPRMLNIRDPLSENVASEADHGDRQL
jgi:hypothetical protein